MRDESVYWYQKSKTRETRVSTGTRKSREKREGRKEYCMVPYQKWKRGEMSKSRYWYLTRKVRGLNKSTGTKRATDEEKVRALVPEKQGKRDGREFWYQKSKTREMRESSGTR